MKVYTLMCPNILFLDFSLQFTYLMFLEGCNTSSKISTKSSTLKVALSKNFDVLVSFGQMDIDEKMITLAEKFLVRCIYKDENINTFDQLRNMVYYKKAKKLNPERFRPTSSSILLHIKCAYLQSYV